MPVGQGTAKKKQEMRCTLEAPRAVQCSDWEGAQGPFAQALVFTDVENNSLFSRISLFTYPALDTKLPFFI